MYLGAHVSIAKSIALAPERGREIGCESIQVFTKNQRQWRAKEISAEEAKEFIENMKKNGIREAVAHTSYLINLGSSNDELWAKSLESLVHEAQRCDVLGIKKLVLHPGTNKDEREGIERIAEGLKKAIDSSKVIIALEITAGQGNSIGHRFEQIARIMELTDKKKISVCFDTCHAYAAGYDIKEHYDQVFEEFDRVIGIEHLNVVHLNDSKSSCGSRLDRHEHIGKGALGIETFRRIVNDKRLSEISGVLETPGGDEDFKRNLYLLKTLRQDKKNLDTLKGLREK